MEADLISLRLEVKKDDANKIIQFLSNKDVTKFLNEDPLAVYSLTNVIKNNQEDLLTYHLNQDGRFFLIDSKDEKCLGFINLFTLQEHKVYEVVIAIGNANNWGQKIAYHALKRCMATVFFVWRINKLIAKVKKDNNRSNSLFLHLGYSLSRETDKYNVYSIDLDKFLNTTKLSN